MDVIHVSEACSFAIHMKSSHFHVFQKMKAPSRMISKSDKARVFIFHVFQEIRAPDSMISMC